MLLVHFITALASALETQQLKLLSSPKSHKRGVWGCPSSKLQSTGKQVSTTPNVCKKMFGNLRLTLLGQCSNTLLKICGFFWSYETGFATR